MPGTRALALAWSPIDPLLVPPFPRWRGRGCHKKGDGKASLADHLLLLRPQPGLKLLTDGSTPNFLALGINNWLCQAVLSSVNVAVLRTGILGPLRHVEPFPMQRAGAATAAAAICSQWDLQVSTPERAPRVPAARSTSAALAASACAFSINALASSSPSLSSMSSKMD